MSTKEPLSKDLFDILACPVCKGDLKYSKDKNGLACATCKYTYPIREGIPILLPHDEQ
jgi:uncharacterized protein YbaR (Trm112 family)